MPRPTVLSPLRPWQSRDHDPTPEEDRLAASIEAAFADGIDDLDALVARVNADGALLGAAEPWTPESFLTAVERLGC